VDQEAIVPAQQSLPPWDIITLTDMPIITENMLKGDTSDISKPAMAYHDRYQCTNNYGKRHQNQLASQQNRSRDLIIWHAQRKVVPALIGALICVVILAGWGARHIYQSIAVMNGSTDPFIWAYTLVFMILAYQMIVCFTERPVRNSCRVDYLKTAIIMPVFNEDPMLFTRCLQSLLQQSQLPDEIYVIDDGSVLDYSVVQAEFEIEATAANVLVSWITFPINKGKRHAHAAAFRAASQADIFITVDSDAILDYYAIEEGMKPFVDSKVKSVAGLLLIANHRKNLLTRATELWYVTSELVDRSAQSAISSVLVNTGTFALYRAPVIRDCLNAYVNETFFGRPVQFSDDSMLTFYAMLAGKTVQQPTAIGFTAMPENLSHHVRQYLRWMRGMTIRTFWRFRYLPLRSYAYWQHMIRWVQALTAIPLFFTVIIIEPIMRGSWPVNLLFIPLFVGYGRSLRYLTIRRYDEPWWSQVLTYLLAPLVAIWAYTVLRFIWWYGIATCLKTGWGTRQNGVEVSL